jgi:hypothetical protein
VLSAATDGVEADSSSVGMPSPSMAFFTRAMGRERRRASPRGSSGAAACRLHLSRFQPCVGVSCVFCARFVHIVVLPFAMPWIP